MSLYFGKYRAKVVEVTDPEKRGRIRVLCPKVLGESKSAWCEPCIPVACDTWGDFCLPEINETVWIEFEEGKANKPIWIGGWYSNSKAPVNYSKAQETRVIGFKTSKISMTDKNVTISASGVSYELNQTTLERLVGLIDELDKIQENITSLKSEIASIRASL